MLLNRKFGFWNALKIFGLIVLLSSCGGGGSEPVTNPPPPPPTDEPPSVDPTVGRIGELWPIIIEPYLTAELWNSQNNYDAAHMLMIPLHWTYAVNEDSQYQQDFEAYFARYVEQGSLAEETNQLRKLQYFYLHSQYLKLKVNNDVALSVDDTVILEELLAEVQYQWLEREANTFGGLNFIGGMQERLEFKLATLDPEPEFARAIFDEEFYLLTIAADLLVILRDEEFPEHLLDIQDAAYRLFRQEGELVDSGWLFQVGVWSHHPDYVYSGNTVLEPGLSQSIIEDIPSDSSHFHRMPLWVKSLRDSYTASQSEYAVLNGIYNRVKNQLEDSILVPAVDEFKAPRLNNFTDGWNGIYRYNFSTVGDNLGFAPYSISGVIPYSWYAFSGSSVLLEEYQNMEFPLSADIVELYVGPNTTRVRHPLVTWPDFFENGFAELNILLATQVISNGVQ